MTSVSAGLWATLIGVALLAGCERPPMESSQRGYRGTGMAQVTNPRIAASIQEAQALPAEVPAVPSDPSAPKAKEAYKNVQVLGDLSVGEFTRTMLAMSAWVSPEQSCNYCHKPGEDLSSDSLYTKVVARKMLVMNKHINGQWKSHVGETGVTCYTCHRGQPVPSQVWFNQTGGRTTGFIADSGGQNMASKQAGLSALGVNVLDAYLVKDGHLRQGGTTALPTGNSATIRQTEGTFGLMMHISESLGVNCTFCHNTRSHVDWAESPLSRTNAYYGIRMARDLNNAHLLPLAGTLPPERLGPTGDVPKVNCATCHQGVSKPLNGAAMAKSFPALAGSGPVKGAAAASTAGTLSDALPAASGAAPGAGARGAAAAAASPGTNAGAPSSGTVSTAAVTAVATAPASGATSSTASSPSTAGSSSTAPSASTTPPSSTTPSSPTTAMAATTPAAGSPSSGAASAEVDVAPDTLVGAGYPEMVSFYFDTAKTTLAADARSQLQQVIAYATTHGDARIGISGYHDRRGGATANVELAKSRAQVTRELLVSAGVPADRIVMVKPRETVGGSDDRAARRVDVYPAR